jgi:hypothetical protein
MGWNPFAKPEGGKDITSVTDVFGTSAGFTNNYTSYNAQVEGTYRKYNARSTWGNSQVINIVNTLSAFISGEGVGVEFTGDPKKTKARDDFNKWYKSWLAFNNQQSAFFTELIKYGVKAGKVVVQLIVKEKQGRQNVFMKIHPYKPGYKWEIIPNNGLDTEDGFIMKFETVENATMTPPPLDSKKDNLFYLRFGSDDDINKTPYKYHANLTDIENYDRALKDLRRLNHVGARITPDFECASEQEVQQTKLKLNASGWKIGQARVGTAKFSYKSPQNTSPGDALLKEMELLSITISANTGIPIHWFGFVHLMSNRSTAETLWDMVNTNTKDERATLADFMYDVIFKAQEIYVDKALNGGDYLQQIKDFKINVQLVDFQRFFNMVKAMSLAHKDNAISLSTYRSFLPGVDASLEAEKVDEEQEQEDINNSIKFPVQPDAGEQDRDIE